MTSPFASSYARLTDNDISVLPIVSPYLPPDTWRSHNNDNLSRKIPAIVTRGTWIPMSGWQQYCKRRPTPQELENWATFQDANIAVAMGAASNLVGLDIDNCPEKYLRKLERIVPPSPVRKRGAKGYTAYYQWRDYIPIMRLRIDGVTFFEILSETTQTLIPPSVHPDTKLPYCWITPDTLEDMPPSALPVLERRHIEEINKLAAEIQKDYGKKEKAIFRAKVKMPVYDDNMWNEVNTRALANLELWVPQLLDNPAFQVHQHSNRNWRGCAFWRGGDSNMSVSIHNEGISDWVSNEGYDPIGIVMQVRELPNKSSALTLLRGLLYTDEITQENSLAEGIIRRHLELKHAIPTASVSELKPRQTARVSAEFAEMPKFQKELFFDQAPGMVGNTARYINDSALYALPELSLASAIATTGTVYGNRITAGANLRTNFICFGIANSGTGKDHTLREPLNVLSELSMNKCVLGELQSGNALINALAYDAASTGGSMLWLQDEVGYFLQGCFEENSSAAYKKSIIPAIMSVFGASGKPIYTGLEYADRKMKKRTDIPYPHLSAYAASTPDTFFCNITSRQAIDGFLARCNIFISDAPAVRSRIFLSEEKPAAAQGNLKEITAEFKENLKRINNKLPAFCPSFAANPYKVPVDPHCSSIEEHYERIIEDKKAIIRSNEYMAKLEPIWNRVGWHIGRLALVASDGKEITAEIYRWAGEVALYQANMLSHIVSNKTFDTEVGKLKRQIYDVVFNYVRDTGHAIMLSEISERVNYRNRDKRDEAIDSLVGGGVLGCEETNKKGAGGRKIAYYWPNTTFD